jgi:murein DD-endopeptidase MepM/ murein hydrolase activator NlpD
VRRLLLFSLLILLGVAGYFFLLWLAERSQRVDLSRTGKVWAWLRNSSAHPEWAVRAGEKCGEAPFIFPTNGMIGFIWGDSFRPGHHHQGLDIFGGENVGVTPVVAAYSGYLTRLPDWKSALIIRIPEDPLQPGRQIWTYYTHMADNSGSSFIVPQFPAGTDEVYVEAGTTLGYQGNYSGDPNNPTGVHLHFSVVKDDGQGKFRNELEIRNTLDPTPYFGLPLNAETNPGDIPVCSG